MDETIQNYFAMVLFLWSYTLEKQSYSSVFKKKSLRKLTFTGTHFSGLNFWTFLVNLFSPMIEYLLYTKLTLQKINAHFEYLRSFYRINC